MNMTRVGGTVVWLKDGQLTEVKKTVRHGVGYWSSLSTVYTYFATFKLLLDRGEAKQVRRIWANEKLIFVADKVGGIVNPEPGFAIQLGAGREIDFTSMPVDRTGWPVSFTAELDNARPAASALPNALTITPFSRRGLWGATA